MQNESDVSSQNDYQSELYLMRTKDLMNAIGKIADKFKAWIEKIEHWIDCLEGDSLMIALSISYLGIFDMKQWITIRNQIANHLIDKKILCDQNWIEDKEFTHNSMFKKLLSERIGEKPFIELSHLFHDNHFAEVVFSFLYANWIPVIVDNTGYFSKFVIE